MTPRWPEEQPQAVQQYIRERAAYARSKRARVPVTCVVCGRVVVGARTRKTCSDACRWRAAYARRRLRLEREALAAAGAPAAGKPEDRRGAGRPEPPILEYFGRLRTVVMGGRRFENDSADLLSETRWASR
jgi:predicted nucleic acid-binding Zn ribbon protein